MPATRRAVKPEKFENHEKVRGYQSNKRAYDFVQTMMEVMSQTNLEPQILIPINEKIEMMEEELQQKSFILMGPGHSGKSATVYWLIRNQMDSKHVIWLDCRVWVTDSSFIKQLLQELSLVFSKQLPKDLVVRGDINFKELHKAIRRENKELIILMKNPEKLAEQTRPVLLYNILEWINSNQSHAQLSFIMITRDIRFIDGGEKRVKSRMNIPIIYLTRPRSDKIKEMLSKRIDYCCRQSPSKEAICRKLKIAIEQKSVDKLITCHYQTKILPISYYLKIMQLILAVGIESEEKWQIMEQKELNSIVLEGFEKYSVYIVDHRNIAKSFFKISHLPEIILMGLFRIRFLRQKEGHYTSNITLGELMNDFNMKKKQVELEEGGTSFLYSQAIMQGALRNLLDWNFLAFSKMSEKVSRMNRELTSRYGPEDIEYLYRECQSMPGIVKAIYNDS